MVTSQAQTAATGEWEEISNCMQLTSMQNGWRGGHSQISRLILCSDTITFVLQVSTGTKSLGVRPEVKQGWARPISIRSPV